MTAETARAAADAAAPTLLSLVAVKPLSRTTFVGRCVEGARGRVFGGQTLAQALFAAGLYCGSDRPPNSLHAYFVGAGNPALPVDYAVTELKSGRALSVVRVDAQQSNRAILTMLASFHEGEESPDLQSSRPETVRPESLDPSTYAPQGSNPAVRAPFDIRYTDAAPTSEEPAPPRQQVWFRARESLPDDPTVHACALAYATDLTLTRTSHMPLRAFAGRRLGSSLDHSMWFHRPLRVDEWLLFVQEGTSYAGSRALSRGEVFDADGRLVASASQEALIRMDVSTGPSPAASGA